MRDIGIYPYPTAWLRNGDGRYFGVDLGDSVEPLVGFVEPLDNVGDSRIVRRGGGKTMVSVVRYRRAMVVLASAGGNTVEVIVRLVQTSPDRVREMIHRFKEMGMASLDPQVGGWPSPPDND